MKLRGTGALAGAGIVVALVAFDHWRGPEREPEWLQAGPYRFQVARTARERQKGLQGVARLPQGGGMLFVQPKGEPATFWMKGCEIPLDIVFIAEDGTVQRLDRATPLRPGEGPVIYTALGPMSPAAARTTRLPATKYVFELAQGEGCTFVAHYSKLHTIGQQFDTN